MYGPKVQPLAHITWKFAWVVPMRRNEDLCQQQNPEFRKYFTSEGFINVKKKTDKQKKTLCQVFMLFYTLDLVYAVETPMGDRCFTNQAWGPRVIRKHFSSSWSLFTLSSRNYKPGADREKNRC